MSGWGDILKVIRDPIHNIIQFDKDTEKVLLDLIDSADFQRLRHIKQLGLSSFTYPGAEHTRFAHSLGVTHLVKRIIDRICSLKGDQYKRYIEEIKEYKLYTLIAALLHDIGHGPFSHALEKSTGIKHEKWTIAIITGNTETNSVLSKHGIKPRDISDIIQRTHRSSAVVKLLSSQLDADRLDYIVRDAKMTGAGYGARDMEWLINVLRIGEVNGNVEVGLDRSKGLSIAEDFIMARYYMYVNVYFHKSTRSAEMLIDRILARALELQQDRTVELPNDLNQILKNKDINKTINNYLNLTDNTIWHYFNNWRSHDDSILRDLTSRLITRQLFKGIDLDINKSYELTSKSVEVAQKRGVAWKYYFLHDQATSSSYKDTYISQIPKSGEKEDEREASEQIILFDKKGKGEELSNISDTVRQIRNKPISIPRLFCPKEYMDELLGG